MPKNKLPLHWLCEANKLFDPRYKKNLKLLDLHSPTHKLNLSDRIDHFTPYFAILRVSKNAGAAAVILANEINEGDISSLHGDSKKIMTTWSSNDDGKKVKSFPPTKFPGAGGFSGGKYIPPS